MSEIVQRIAFATCSSIPCICRNRMGFDGMPCLKRGRDALEAMREPTEAMIVAGSWGPMTAPDRVWQRMVDAALEE